MLCDLASGFHQIAMDPDLQHKTACATPFGLDAIWDLQRAGVMKNNDPRKKLIGGHFSAYNNDPITLRSHYATFPPALYKAVSVR